MNIEQTNNNNGSQVDLNGNKVTEVAPADRKPESIKSDKFPRVQSPSSINTFKQCPRKYYFHYIEKLASFPSIHLIRGKLTHSILEDFFDVNVEHLTKDNFMFDSRVVLTELFKKHWEANRNEMETLKLTPAELKFYKDETFYMVMTWHKRFVHEVAEQMKTKNFKEAFNYHTPIREEEYRSETKGVRGFIDAIYEFEKEVTGLDIAKHISEGLANVAIAIEVNSQLKDLNTKITQDSNIKINPYDNLPLHRKLIDKKNKQVGFFDLGNHILIVGMVLLVIFVSMNVD